jgi:hypothetical protein
MQFLKQFSVALAVMMIVFSQSSIATSYAATPVTVITVPAPTVGQVQGMITAVGAAQVIIDTLTVTHDGDTVITYNGGLTALAVGQMVNYSYTVDVDGVILATTMDVYPAESITSTDRVSRIDVTNATSIVALTLYRGPIVDFYQASGIYVQGAGTQTSFGCQLVNYTGYINPTTGHIIASGLGYMSDIPVKFVSPTAHFVAGTPASHYTIDYSQYGMPCLLFVTATGLPPGLTNNMGAISGTPTTPGTYTVTMTAVYGDHSVAAYSTTSSTIVIVVDSGVVVPPPPPADTTAPVIVMNGGDVTLTEGDAYTDAGATCTDNKDTICTVVATSTVDATTAGIYTVTYSATDAAGNVATPVVRTVTVNPIPAPVCSGTDQVITNAANVRAAILEIGGGPSNGGIAIQIFQNSTTIVAPLTTATFFRAGNIISYVGTMNAANLCVTSATISAPLPPPDTTGPVITMNGTNATLVAGTVYTDAGATCVDNVDTTCSVNSASTVNTATAGIYTVTYSATDAAGNVATPVVRTVTVTPVPDTTAPVITMIGGNVSLVAGTPYTDAGATCTDNKDLTCTVVKTSTVNTATAGTYTVTYRATDAAGNVATPVVRTVTVTPVVIVTPPPTTGVVSTGVKVEGTNKIITAISATTINIGTLVIRLTPTTVVQLNNGKPLKVGDRIEYKGVKNTDGSITATIVKIQ